MKKRIISATLILTAFLSLLSIRLFVISTDTEIASANSATRTKVVSRKRGTVYDRNLSPLVNDTQNTVALVKPTAENIVLIGKIKGKNYISQTLAKGYFAAVPLGGKDKITDSESIKTMQVYERYGGISALHIIGYTDSEGKGVCGIEKYFENELSQYNGTLSVSFSADAFGHMLLGEKAEIRDDNYYSDGGIMLTIDKSIQEITENALINGNIAKGCAIVLDIESGEILSSASMPLYDRSNLSAALENVDSPFINRALTAYPVGSVFKVVTAAAALRQGIFNDSFLCEGHIAKSGNIFYCSKRTGHGEIDFNIALSHSCNPYFIDLSVKAGAEMLLETAKSLGLGKAVDLGNGYCCDSGILPDIKELNSEAAVGNFGFGQGRLTATPLQIAALYSTIARGGVYIEASLYKGTVDSELNVTKKNSSLPQRVLNENVCKTISDALAFTTVDGTGKEANSEYFSSCAKTATAQSGQYDENGNEIKYCWFVGYFPKDNPKYTVLVLKENGSSGGIDGAPVYREICENIYKLYEINEAV